MNTIDKLSLQSFVLQLGFQLDKAEQARLIVDGGTASTVDGSHLTEQIGVRVPRAARMVSAGATGVAMREVEDTRVHGVAGGGGEVVV